MDSSSLATFGSITWCFLTIPFWCRSLYHCYFKSNISIAPNLYLYIYCFSEYCKLSDGSNETRSVFVRRSHNVGLDPHRNINGFYNDLQIISGMQFSKYHKSYSFSRKYSFAYNLNDNVDIFCEKIQNIRKCLISRTYSDNTT